MNSVKFYAGTLLLTAACTGTGHAAVFSPEELGTPSGKVSLHALRITPVDVLETAMPRYDQTKLQQHLMRLAGNAEALAAARGLDSIPRTGGQAMLEMGSRRETGNVSVNAAGGELHFERAGGPEALSTVSLAMGHQQKAMIAGQHKLLLAKYGIDSHNTQLIETNVLAQQTEPLNGSGIASEPRLQGYLSVAVRAAGELIVEDQRARLVSDREGRLRTVDLNWPVLKLSSATASGNLKSRAEVLKEVSARLGGKPQLEQVDVRMAVVLRPSSSSLGTVHIPAMRVGITPRNGEAGEIFYVDLSREPSAIPG
ncbi:hypothetical protein [Chitinimonas sp. BJB300]|uniref:hypothetical protein n=1 Tax=Chitinimonas sp. BJB300 TaxID=1559339 RepID=UPI000C0DAE0A|nr:hypothetical protein [Chitinimonas sp. BJB300]PHV09907.1 hypothetical protein CSQ89_19100 [Chitinimonas sp. BJB300]TSJ90097.1 hypothetical protein FG002_007890 [Chitinimonas sp. BJB300]